MDEEFLVLEEERIEEGEVADAEAIVAVAAGEIVGGELGSLPVVRQVDDTEFDRNESTSRY